MISSQQAQKACIIAQFCTSKNLPITIFKYSETEKLIRIKAGFRDKQIKIVINKYGKAKYV